MELTKGANLTLGTTTGDHAIGSLLLGLDWESGDLECDVCALVCGPDRKVLDDDHFLYWDNTVSPQRTVFLRSATEDQADAQDRAQVLVNVAELPEQVDRILVVLATVVDGGKFDVLKTVRLRVLDLQDGRGVADFSTGQAFSNETCVIVGELYRNKGDWKLRAVGQGYQSGLAGLGSEYGVNITD
ncbi:MAG: TerD family protein [Actinomycetota bacterium]